MAQTNDPRMPNYGRANYGQLAPNMTAANSQPQRFPTQGQSTSPMAASLQRAPQQPAPSPMPSGKPTAAVGTFGPKQGIATRGKTDFGKGGWQGGFNAIGSALNVKSPFGAAFGIQRRAKGSQNDYSVGNATEILQRQYGQQLGRQASPQEIQSQLAGQGLKPGDNWVGNKGLDAVLASIQNSPEAQAFRGNPQAEAPEAPVNQMGNTFESPAALGAAIQPKTSGAQSAYQEYLGEFGPDDPEQPLDYETFSQYYSQLPPEAIESPMEDAVASGRRGWENLLLDMQGEQATPMSFSGFDMERALAGGDPDSVKDAFARAASTFGTDLRGMSKQEVGAIIGSPEFHQTLAAQGIQSRPIPGAYDQIEVFTKERGWEVKDIVANAGSPEAQWWWGDVGMGPEAGMDMGMSGEYLMDEGEDTSQQSALLQGLTGGQNWKTLLEQLLSQYGNG
jgi:hypothetical protein